MIEGCSLVILDNMKSAQELDRPIFLDDIQNRQVLRLQEMGVSVPGNSTVTGQGMHGTSFHGSGIADTTLQWVPVEAKQDAFYQLMLLSGVVLNLSYNGSIR
ncbi:hypothetical protein M9H77_05981 [Catharanthus roseus]|uniref:Uncharacterized protein n=1 Tax=Catharanthus roseus TaxID=4058 RepID=A0ACC0BQT3_CATRO|nr:hypothetical protein M9H77_05981 [Catharanthus roseus]